ncbi:hypothetical protein BO71DRAFT_104173 [Aspergillus ellipticus CBS 707.79]|uniref:Uncharacterized protein n=1 Tax=Aspergillus ellipticus CBS 707.79 TaxID=1448320 RepID=A0A319DF11_9EURO|nr:hypothetical protein BO71DRAFT_104173 [Aspergillus ellipticus CBS 707.79]
MTLTINPCCPFLLPLSSTCVFLRVCFGSIPIVSLGPNVFLHLSLAFGQLSRMIIHVQGPPLLSTWTGIKVLISCAGRLYCVFEGLFLE